MVRDAEGDHPRLLVMNWLDASRGEGSATSYPMTAGTQHIEDYFPNPAKVYLAPEALSGEDDAAGIRADVFSLGAIAYHLFAGRPPADNPLYRTGCAQETGYGSRMRSMGSANGSRKWYAPAPHRWCTTASALRPSFWITSRRLKQSSVPPNL